jgi:hypothetical protein
LQAVIEMETSAWQRLKPLIDGYNLRPLRVHEPAPGYFHIETVGRTYTGRITARNSASVRQRVGDYVAAHGFRRVERFIKNMFSERMVSIEDGQGMFYLTDYFTGRTLETVKVDLKLAVENLAELHTALDGCAKATGVTALAQRARYGTWTQAFQKGFDRLGVERLLLSTKSDHALPDGALPWLEQWEIFARHALTGLDDANYPAISKSAAERFEVAWNGYRLDDLVLQTNNTVATRQRLDPVLDNQLYDLAALVLQICEAGDPDGAMEAIELYSKLRPLTAGEKHIVYSFAIYPHFGQRLVRELRSAHTTGRAHRIEEIDGWLQAERHLNSANKLLAMRSGLGG